MNRITTGSLLLLLATSMAAPAHADSYRPGQRGAKGRNPDIRGGVRWGHTDTRNLQSLADRLERDTDALVKELDRSLDAGRHDGTRLEDRINEAAQELENAADRLGKHASDRSEAREAADDVFDEAAELDRLVTESRLDARTQRTWRRVDADLASLSAFFPRLAERDDDRDDRRHDRGSNDWRRHRERSDRNRD